MPQPAPLATPQEGFLVKYSTYLKNQNLAANTITAYERHAGLWLNYIAGRRATKGLVVRFLNAYGRTHAPNSTKLLYAALMAYFRYKKEHKLVQSCQDIRLPSTMQLNRTIIDLATYEARKVHFHSGGSWHQQRNWLIFTVLFTTGIRAGELSQVKKSTIKNHMLVITGKGNKQRQIFLSAYLLERLAQWPEDQISITRRGRQLTYKQINAIVRTLTQTWFEQPFTPHDLRRSYATNLLRRGIDLKTISLLLGHANINTTARYIFYTQEEIYQSIKDLF